jgi:thymidylate synthase (FAD)
MLNCSRCGAECTLYYPPKKYGDKWICKSCHEILRAEVRNKEGQLKSKQVEEPDLLTVDDVEIIKEPSVHVIGKTAYLGGGLSDYLDECGVNVTSGSPAAKLLMGSTNDSSLVCEIAGRKCYNSWLKGRKSDSYFEHIKEVAHGSILTHGNLTFIISGISRSCSMEFIRHHVGVGISQESQRFIAYDEPYMVLHPTITLLDERSLYQCADNFVGQFNHYRERQATLKKVLQAKGYNGTMLKKRMNEAARMCLPNETATSLVWTANFRALRNVLTERGGQFADLEIRRLACAMLRVTHKHVKYVFDDFFISEDEFGKEFIVSKHGKI